MTTTETAFHSAKAEAFGGRLMSILSGSLLSSMVDIGHRTGLFAAAAPRVCRAVRPGGWLVLGRMAPPPDLLVQATFALRTIRGGGAEFDAKRLITSLEAAGCTAVRALPRQGPAPLEYVIGQRAGNVTR